MKEHIKGLLYIEAFKKAHVEQAIEGVSSLNANKITVRFFKYLFLIF